MCGLLSPRGRQTFKLLSISRDSREAGEEQLALWAPERQGGLAASLATVPCPVSQGPCLCFQEVAEGSAVRTEKAGLVLREQPPPCGVDKLFPGKDTWTPRVFSAKCQVATGSLRGSGKGKGWLVSKASHSAGTYFGEHWRAWSGQRSWFSAKKKIRPSCLHSALRNPYSGTPVGDGAGCPADPSSLSLQDSVLPASSRPAC